MFLIQSTSNAKNVKKLKANSSSVIKIKKQKIVACKIDKIFLRNANTRFRFMAFSKSFKLLLFQITAEVSFHWKFLFC